MTPGRDGARDRVLLLPVFVALVITVAVLLVSGIVKIAPEGDSVSATDATLPADDAGMTDRVTPPTAATTASRPAPGQPAPVVARVATDERVIFLSIDDGITRDPAVLDYLKTNDIPFTSFLVTGPLEADTPFWARHRAIGGTIQAHTLTHANLTKLSADEIRNELCGSADVIQRVTGVRPNLFRPPYGAYNATVQAVAAECGYLAIVMWMGSLNDGRLALQEAVLKPGDILLLHWRPDLLLNLQNVVALAKAQGFTIAKLENFLAPIP